MHDLVTQYAFGVYNEETTQRYATVFQKHAVVARYRLRGVRCERVFQSFHSTFGARRLQPRAVRVDRVGRDAYKFRAYSLEIFVAVAERGQLSGADESEIERVEKQYEPLAPVIRKLDVLFKRLEIFCRSHVEIGRWLAHHSPLSCHCCCLHS